eukprot:GFYU01007351.1.p1 GENE.GFYU01007351.1~~GFYU01007351.1.p1  ORF type:complete len:465 (+),score=103.02 GFYU01007351.1:237-1631(+)
MKILSFLTRCRRMFSPGEGESEAPAPGNPAPLQRRQSNLEETLRDQGDAEKIDTRATELNHAGSLSNVKYEVFPHGITTVVKESRFMPDDHHAPPSQRGVQREIEKRKELVLGVHFSRSSATQPQSFQSSKDNNDWSFHGDAYPSHNPSEDGIHIVSHQEFNTEDDSRRETIFCGVYDGHGNRGVVDYLTTHLHTELMTLIAGGVSVEEALREAFTQVDREVIDLALEALARGEFASVFSGACCLVAYLTPEQIVMGNTGDCRAILGFRKAGQLYCQQLTFDHNAREPREQRLMKISHPDEDAIVEVKRAGRGLYVKGQLQCTRTIGDGYLKDERFNKSSNMPQPLRVDEPFNPPYISSVPEITRYDLDETCEFVVMATDGLYDELSNESIIQAVDNFMRQAKTDNNKSPENAGTMLRDLALSHSASIRGTTKKQLQKIPPGSRRSCVHDDISVSVIFLKPLGE